MPARKPLVVAADGHPAPLQSPDLLLLPSYTVAQLKAMTGVTAGAKAYASDGRAITGLAALVEGAPGGGCEVTFTNAGVWRITGTAITVSA